MTRAALFSSTCVLGLIVGSAAWGERGSALGDRVQLRVRAPVE